MKNKNFKPEYVYYIGVFGVTIRKVTKIIELSEEQMQEPITKREGWDCIYKTSCGGGMYNSARPTNYVDSDGPNNEWLATTFDFDSIVPFLEKEIEHRKNWKFPDEDNIRRMNGIIHNIEFWGKEHYLESNNDPTIIPCLQ